MLGHCFVLTEAHCVQEVLVEENDTGAERNP